MMMHERIVSKELEKKELPFIIKEIVRCNPKIEKMEFCKYGAPVNKNPDFFWKLSREQILLQNAVDDLVSPKYLVKEDIIGLSSLVQLAPKKIVIIEEAEKIRRSHFIYLEPTHMHIPMILFSDECFRGKKLKEVGKQIKDFLISILEEKKGWLLFSRSYYFRYLGANLLSPEEFNRFMVKCLIKNEKGIRFVDPKWVFNCLGQENKRLNGGTNGYANVIIVRAGGRMSVPQVFDYIG